MEPHPSHAGGSIATGFFQKMGEDLYEKLKEKLTRRYDQIAQPELLEFDFSAEHDQRPVQVIILAESPTSGTVAALMDGRFPRVDELVEYAVKREADLAKVVLRWDGADMRLAYAVRVDAVPVHVDWELVPALPESLEKFLTPGEPIPGSWEAEG